MSAASVEERFESLCAETRAQMPDEESATQIVSAYRKHWTSPPLEQLEGCQVDFFGIERLGRAFKRSVRGRAAQA